MQKWNNCFNKKTIDDEQDTEITYYFGQELSGTKTSLEEYIENIQKVNKADILEVAKQISINTILFFEKIKIEKWGRPFFPIRKKEICK